MITHYTVKGICFGNCWGGGKLGYSTKEYVSTSIEDLFAKINDGIKNGSIDSGMGFESVYGAIMKISTIRRIYIEGKEFTNIETDEQSFGNISSKEFDAIYED